MGISMMGISTMGDRDYAKNLQSRASHVWNAGTKIPLIKFRGLKFYPNVNEKTTSLARNAMLNKLPQFPLTSEFNDTL